MSAWARQIWSHLRYGFRLHVDLAVSAVLTAVGLVLIAFGGHSITDIIGWITTAIGLGRSALDLKKAWLRRRNTRIVENEDYAEALASCALPHDFEPYVGKILGLNHPALDRQALAGLSIRDSRPYITNAKVNGLLDSSRNPLQILGTRYEMPDRLQAYRAHCVNLKRPHFNDPKLRLRTDITEPALASGKTVDLQHTDYFSSAATNEVACEQFELVKSNHLGGPEVLAAVSDWVVAGGRLINLSDSELSNHIGISTLVLSADDEIILQDQGAQCVSANETGVGASGSLDAADLARLTADRTLQALCRIGMEREAVEELSAKFPSGGAGTVLTGYARYLARGGKPEFFGISRSTTKRCDMVPMPTDRRYVSGIRGEPFLPTVVGLGQAIDQLLGEGTVRRRYSLSMIVCLRLAREWLERASEEALARLSIRSVDVTVE